MKKIALIIGLMLCNILNFAQSDTIPYKMRLDLGITRDKNVNLWPFFKRSITDEKRELQVLFPLYQKTKFTKIYKSSSYLFPVYWHQKDTIGKDLRLFSTYYPSLFHYQSNRNEGSKGFHLLELMPNIEAFAYKRSADGAIIDNNLLFFLWYKQNKRKQKLNIVVFPLYWYFNSPDRTSNTFFPVFSYGNYRHKQYQYFAVTPFYWHSKHQHGSRSMLVPLYWNKKSYYGKDTSASTVVFPVFWNYSNSKRENTILFPILWNFKNDFYSSTTCIPLFSVGRCMYNDNKHLVITPFYYNIQHDNGTDNVLFPLWWQHTRNGNYYSHTIFPIYWERRDRQSYSKIFFPFAYQIYQNKYYSFTAFPFFSKGYADNGLRSHQIITPLYYRFQNNSTMFTALAPLYWKQTSDTGMAQKSSMVIFPLYWQHQSFFRSYNVLFPLYWQFREDTGMLQKRQIALFPLYWHTKSHFENNIVLFPWYWKYKNQNKQSVTLFPLFSYGSNNSGGKYIFVAPLYYQQKSNYYSQKVLFPLLWHEKKWHKDFLEKNTIIFPLYWQTKQPSFSKLTFFPLYWYRKDKNYSSHTFFPFYSYGRSSDSLYSHLAVSPFYWRFKNRDFHYQLVFPVWWNKKFYGDSGQVFSSSLFLLYWHLRHNEKSNTVLFPAVWYFSNKNYYSFTFVPLCSFGRNTVNSSNYLILPLYAHFHKPDKRLATVFPVYWNLYRDGKNGKEKFIFSPPLFWQFTDSTQKNTVIAPLLWSFKKKQCHSFIFFPLYASGKSCVNFSEYRAITPVYWQFKNGENQQRVLFPLLWNNYKKISAEHYLKSDVLFPIYWHYQSPVHENEVLFPLVWLTKNKHYQSFTMLPVFSTGKATNGQRRHTMAALLYWNFKDTSGTNELLLPFYYRKTHIFYSDTSTTRMFMGLYWDYKNQNSFTQTIFPLIWNVNTNRRYDFVFFPVTAFGHSKTRKNSYYTFAFLYYHHKKEYYSRDVFFPLFWNYSEKIDEYFKKRTVLFPLYFARHTNHVNNKTLFPLIWYRYRPSYCSFTFFPVFSYGSDSSNRHNYQVITPLFWNIKKRDYHATTLFPVFSRIAKNDETRAHVLFLFYRYYQQQQYRSMSLMWPFCQYKSGDSLKYFHVAPLLWYKKSAQRNYFSIQPFYYFSQTPTQRNLNILWQVYVYENEFNSRRSNYFLWRLFYSRKFANHDYETRLLYLLYANVKKEGNREFSIFPLFHKVKLADGNSNTAIAFYFYQYLQKTIPETNAVYLEERIFWFLRLRSNYKYLEASGKLGNFKRRK